MIPYSLAFRKPFQVWKAYFRRIAPAESVVNFRDGYRAWLSENPHDIITLMVNFCKREYGTISQGSLVVDIGANIGMFSLLACRSGAEKLLAFEPNPSSFEILRKNLFQALIKTDVAIFPLAVSGMAGETVYMSVDSSPYNATSNNPINATNVVSVETIDLDKIVELCRGRQIDYLKIDCEGAEWEILSKCSEETLSRIDRIRMELHPRQGRSNSEIIDRLLKNGFRLVHSKHLVVRLDRKSIA